MHKNLRHRMRLFDIIWNLATVGGRLCAVFPLIALALLCTHAEAWGQAAEGIPLTDLPRAVLVLGGRSVDVQVAATPEARQTGLMFRASLPADEGMLFVHDALRVRCMWMQNTLIPLTAAFLDEDGRILGFADMEPLTTQSHCSPGPAAYVLEMNQGWFARHGVVAGQRIDLAGVGARP